MYAIRRLLGWDTTPRSQRSSEPLDLPRRRTSSRAGSAPRGDRAGRPPPDPILVSGSPRGGRPGRRGAAVAVAPGPDRRRLLARLARHRGRRRGRPAAGCHVLAAVRSRAACSMRPGRRPRRPPPSWTCPPPRPTRPTGDTLADARGFTDRDALRGTHPDAVAHARSDGDARPDAPSDRTTDATSDGPGDGGAHPEADAQAHPEADAQAHPEAHAQADADAGAACRELHVGESAARRILRRRRAPWASPATPGTSVTASRLQCPSPTHAYLEPGNYQVTLTVTGPGGSDSQTRTVSVP